MPRRLCLSCQRPLEVCYCNSLVTIFSKIKVIILQHPLEQSHPFNTGRMAHLCLVNSTLMVTEILSDKSLDNILSKPSALLYPSLTWLPKTLELLSTHQNNSGEALDENHSIDQLIVIDATWRKSKKMLHLNPELQKLPRINLTGNLTSNYKIRKTSMKDGLSTIESIAQAMQILEPNEDFKSMLKPFDKMVLLQQNKEKKNTEKAL